MLEYHIMDGRMEGYMIKYRLFITLVCLCMLCTSGIGSVESNAMEGDGLILANDVTKVDVNAGGPSYLEHQKYNYTTSSKNEIAYILNYINNFNLEDDEKTLYANDVSSYSVKIYTIDGSIKKCGFYSGRFYDDSDKQYSIDRNEYNRFLDFIYALKTDKIVLDGEVTFEPSEWAKEDVNKAIECELVPKLNQINYTGKVNRLEVCQLIDSLLGKQSIAEPESTENPFSDTSDKSVTSLYSHGIIHGKTDNMFLPYDYITREEVAKILSNTYDLLNEKSQSSDSMHEYADQEEIADWALNYVNDMYALDIMIGNSDNEFKPKDNITKEELIIAMLRIYK